MEEKLCKKCNEYKTTDNFRYKKDKNGKYYIYSYCKDCEKLSIKKELKKEANKRYRSKHKEAIQEYNKMWISNNKEYKKEINKIYRINNKEKIQEYQKNYYKEHKKELLQKSNEYKKERRNNNIVFKMKCQIRHMIGISFNKKGLNKSKHTEEIVGIPLVELYDYLKQTFKNNYGYEWDGIEKVHIDHIMPLSTATTEEEVNKLCYYTNLQLLKARDNLKKHNKLNYNI